VPRLSNLYFLYSMLEGDWINLGSFLAFQLYSAATSSAYRIVIKGLISPISRLVGVELKPDDRVAGSERLNLTAFE